MPKTNSHQLISIQQRQDSRLGRKYRTWRKRRNAMAKASRRANAK
jgi:hypothetical protein